MWQDRSVSRLFSGEWIALSLVRWPIVGSQAGVPRVRPLRAGPDRDPRLRAGWCGAVSSMCPVLWANAAALCGNRPRRGDGPRRHQPGRDARGGRGRFKVTLADPAHVCGAVLRGHLGSFEQQQKLTIN